MDDHDKETILAGILTTLFYVSTIFSFEDIINVINSIEIDIQISI